MKNTGRVWAGALFLAAGVSALLLTLHGGEPAARAPAPRVLEVSYGEEPARPPPDWRAAYRGGMRITGRVHAPDGASHAGARVLCLPAGLRPSLPEQYDALTTTADETGAFTFDAISEEPFYFFAAWNRGWYGQDKRWGREVRSAPVSVMLRPLSYERFELVEEDGTAVDVAGRHLSPFSPCTVLASSHGFRDAPVLFQILESMGIRLDAARNEAIHVLTGDAQDPANRGTCGAGKMGEPITIAWPGYEPEPVTVEHFPISAWPKRQRIVLRRSGAETAVPYRVRFPDIAWPEGWGPPDERFQLKLYVELEGTPMRVQLSPALDHFYAPRGANLRILHGYASPLDYERIPTAEGFEIRPVYPRYGYLDVLYDRKPDAEKILRIVASQPEAPENHGTWMWPGYARFGPLPEGDYRIDCFALPAGTVAPRELLASLGVARVRAGLGTMRVDG